ncbi:MAG: lipid droplet-associated protein [Actinomycetota bacterium]|nr:lipid droplet-associated protein [Actinomycetota bacterium]
MSPLPLPVRLAAGLAATAVDQARKLPTQLAGLPVTVASRALQLSMRVQQHVTELAIKGDEVFASLREVDDTPPWARFDEDDDVHRGDGDIPPATVRTGPSAAAGGGGAPDVAAEVPPDVPVEIDEADVAQALTPDRPPPAPPGYDELTLAQLRAKLRTLSAEQLEALLEHEQRHRNRAPFVTMLTNRITTVRSR